jgi:hypothetical protein
LQRDEEPVSWQDALAQDPDYYMNTKQGQEELAQMIRRESERLLEEIGRSVKRTKEIVWLSRYCTSCKFFLREGSKLHCERWDVRIVKPFYGRPVWETVTVKGNESERERVVANIDWTKKWKEISNKIVEWAIDKVNGGFPYYCYTRD